MSVIKNKLDKEKVLSKYGGRCAYCGCELDINTCHIDHIVPRRRHLSKPVGENCIENYNPSCKSCNSSKSSWDLEQWRKEISLKRERIVKYNSNVRLLKRFSLIEIKEQEVKFYFETYK